MDILNVDDAELQRRCAFPAWAEPLGVLRGHDSRPRFCLVSLAWPPFGWSATYTSPSCRPTVWLQCRTTNVTPTCLCPPHRRAAWTAPPLKATSGTLYKYIKNVAPASMGCVTDA